MEKKKLMICELAKKNNCEKTHPECYHSRPHEEAIFNGKSYCKTKNLCDNLLTGAVKTVCVYIDKK